MTLRPRVRHLLWLGLFWFVLGAPLASAGNHGFFTSYTHHLARGEIELMFMNDFTSPSSFKRAEGQGKYFSHMIELEYGVTDQLAIEPMIEWFEDVDTGAAEFTGFRWETRYRLFHDDVPLNPVLYVEYEDLDPLTRFKMEVSGFVNPPYAEEEGEEPGRERILESRLVLSQEFGPVVVALNSIFESDLRSGETAFGYSLGIMYHPEHGSGHAGHAGHGPGAAGPEGGGASGCACKAEMKGCRCAHCADSSSPCACAKGGALGLGLELYGAFGDTRKFGLYPARQEHYLAPVVMYHFTPTFGVHVEFAFGLTGASDDVLRTAIGFEF
ncbi:MAG: hypothetical protein HZA54_08820 [Planctomycetes bacterium]|nr:hypothetical protein [Planctomycetota bacterium]